MNKETLVSDNVLSKDNLSKDNLTYSKVFPLILEAQELLNSNYQTKILFSKLLISTSYSLRTLLSDNYTDHAIPTLNTKLFRLLQAYDKLTGYHYHPDNYYLDLISHESNLPAQSLINAIRKYYPKENLATLNSYAIILDRLIIISRLIPRGNKLLSTPVYKLAMLVAVHLALVTPSIAKVLDTVYFDSSPLLHTNSFNMENVKYRKGHTREHYLKLIKSNP